MDESFQLRLGARGLVTLEFMKGSYNVMSILHVLLFCHGNTSWRPVRYFCRTRLQTCRVTVHLLHLHQVTWVPVCSRPCFGRASVTCRGHPDPCCMQNPGVVNHVVESLLGEGALEVCPCEIEHRNLTSHQPSLSFTRALLTSEHLTFGTIRARSDQSSRDRRPGRPFGKLQASAWCSPSSAWKTTVNGEVPGIRQAAWNTFWW